MANDGSSKALAENGRMTAWTNANREGHSLHRFITLALLQCVFANAGLAAAPLPGPPADGRYLYVMAPGIRNQLEFGGAGILLFDIDKGHVFVRRIETPASLEKSPENIKGVCGSAVNGRLYYTTLTKLAAMDLITEEVLWSKNLEGGCDRPAIIPSGEKLYVPSLEGPHWNVINGTTGDLITRIEPDSGAHNTLTSLDGSRAYLAGLKSPLLVVVDTRSDKPLGTVGPFSSAIRPFTVNGSGTLCFVTVNDFLGFEIGDMRTGKMAERVSVKGFEKGTPKRHGCPCHGIALTRDEKEVWLCDAANRRIHFFDATRFPPRMTGSVELREEPGWITFGIDGRFGYASTGDVIDAATKKIVAVLTDEESRAVGSEKMLEIDWSGGRPIRVGCQFGVGHEAKPAVLPNLPKPPATKPPAKKPDRPAGR